VALRVGWVSVSPVAKTGYGNVTREVVARLLDRYEVTCIAHESDVIVWGGRKEYDLPGGKKVTTLVMTNPLACPVQRAVDMVRAYVLRHRLDLLVAFWDSVPSYSPLLVRKPPAKKGGLYSVDVTTIGDLWLSTDGTVTSNGWEEVKTLRTPIEIPVTKHRWTRIRRIIRHPANGNLIRFNTYGGLLDITPNHSVYVKTPHPQKAALRDAKTLQIGDRLSMIDSKLNRKSENSNYERLLPPLFVGNLDLAWLYGFFAAEGHASIRKNRHGYFYLANTSEEMIEKAVEIVENNFHLKMRRCLSTKKDRYGEREVWLAGNCSRTLAEHFRSLFYTSGGNKKVPTCILNAPKKVKRAFLEGYNDGDGVHEDRTTFAEFGTDSWCLAEGLRLLIKEILDRKCTIHARRDKPNFVKLWIPKNPDHPRMKDRFIIKRIEPVPYRGYLYDLETDDHTFTTGIGGFKVHNSFALGFLKQVGAPYLAMIPVDGPMTKKWYEYVNQATRIITYSKFGFRELQRFAPPSQVVYIPHGIDCSVFKPLNEDKGSLRAGLDVAPPVPEDCFLFLFVGANIGPRKLIPLLMRTFARFARRHPDAHLLLHTNAYAEQRGYDLLSLASEFGIQDRVHFPTMNPILEGKSDEEMVQIFNAADVYVTNSIAEGFGIPLLEAAACGIPAIAPRNSSQEELVEGHGWLVENVPEDVYVEYPVYVPQCTKYPAPDQRDMLRKMEEAYQREDLRKEYGKRAREFALGYDWDKITPMWFRLLEAVEEELSLLKETFR